MKKTKTRWVVINTKDGSACMPKIYQKQQEAYDAVDDWYQYIMDEYAVDPGIHIEEANVLNGFAYIRHTDGFVEICQALPIQMMS